MSRLQHNLTWKCRTSQMHQIESFLLWSLLIFNWPVLSCTNLETNEHIYVYIISIVPLKYWQCLRPWNWLVDGLNPYLLNLDAACSFVLDCELSSSSPSVSLSSESSCHHHNKNDWAQRIQRLQSTNLVFIFRLVVIFHIKTKTKHVIVYFSIPPSPHV